MYAEFNGIGSGEKLSGSQFQELCVVHLLVRQILSVKKQSIGGNRRRCVLRFLFAAEVDGAERNMVFFRRLLNDRDILCIERTLAGVVKKISASL